MSPRLGHLPSIREGEIRRGRILEFLKFYQVAHGYAPNFREIADAVGLRSAATVKHQLELMELEGSISRQPNVSRAIRVLVA